MPEGVYPMNKKLSAVLLALIFSIVLTAKPANAAGEAVEFYVDPSQILLNSSTVPIGFKFNVTVMWSDTASPLHEAYAYQVTMQYNATLLNCTNAWKPTWDNTWLFYGKTIVGLLSEYRVGETLVGESLLGVSSASSSLAPIAIFEFEVLTKPPEGQTYTSALNINNIDTYWLDFDLNEGPIIKTNGTYIIPEFPQNIVLIMAILALCFVSIILSKRNMYKTKSPHARVNLAI